MVLQFGLAAKHTAQLNVQKEVRVIEINDGERTWVFVYDNPDVMLGWVSVHDKSRPEEFWCMPIYMFRAFLGKYDRAETMREWGAKVKLKVKPKTRTMAV